jgi:hypothetical protein
MSKLLAATLGSGIATATSIPAAIIAETRSFFVDMIFPPSQDLVVSNDIVLFSLMSFPEPAARMK